MRKASRAASGHDGSTDLVRGPGAFVLNGLLDPGNELFALARRGRRLTNLPLVVLLSVVIPLGSASGGLLYTLLVPDAPHGASALLSALNLTVVLVLSFFLVYVLLWLWLSRFEGRPFRTLGLRRYGALAGYLRGALVGLAMFAAAVAIVAALGFLSFERGDPALQGFGALGGVLLVYMGWTVQASAEEVLFRGWVLQTVGARYRPWLGVLVSSALFTALHLLNPNVAPLAVLNLFLFGVFAALYALREGGLWGICALHAVWNWAQGNLFGFEVSGGSISGGALLNLREAGPDLLTGGPFGPEGGLAVSAVLLAGIAVVRVLAARSPEGSSA